MSRPSLRGGLKANAVVLARLLNSPSTRKDNSVLPAMNDLQKSLIALALLTPHASAAIDSGGGKTTGGTTSSHGSIGEPFATLPATAATVRNRPGLVEVLYPASSGTAGDADGNGLPDSWELANFGVTGVDPNADPDHDGTNNRMEYLAGTHPNNAASVFRPQGIYQNGVFRLPVSTVAGRNYRVWVTRDLKAWTLDATLTGNNAVQQYQFDETAVPSGPLHSDHHPSAYFFRVEILIP